MGGTLARYAAERVEMYLLTATRGERGWFGDEKDNPGLTALGKIREAELRCVAETLGIREVCFMDYIDGELNQAPHEEAVAIIVSHIRRIRPDFVITFVPDGAYGYPDQNSRGFRAMKVWLALRQEYVQMIGDDIRLSKDLFRLVSSHPELKPFTQNLSITTFRFVPKDMESGSEKVEEYLNQLNTELVTRLQRGGEVFVSNAVLDGRFLLRACIVNFRTTLADLAALIEVLRVGHEIDSAMRPEGL